MFSWLFASASRQARPSYRPRLEILEERALLSSNTFTWTTTVNQVPAQTVVSQVSQAVADPITHLKITVTPAQPGSRDVFQGQFFDVTVTALDKHNHVVASGPGASDSISFAINAIRFIPAPPPGQNFYYSILLDSLPQNLASGTATFRLAIGATGRFQLTIQDTAAPQVPLAHATVNVIAPPV
jgi:hypothetical protein